MTAVFLDTSFAVAVTLADDPHHPVAVIHQDDLLTSGRPMVTHRGVLLEIGNALSKRRLRPAGLRLLRILESDPQIEIVEVTPALYAAGLDLYAARPDKEWGLVDCVSFALMAERGLTDALTADAHFTQAGFAALLA